MEWDKWSNPFSGSTSTFFSSKRPLQCSLKLAKEEVLVRAKTDALCKNLCNEPKKHFSHRPEFKMQMVGYCTRTLQYVCFIRALLWQRARMVSDCAIFTPMQEFKSRLRDVKMQWCLFYFLLGSQLSLKGMWGILCKEFFPGRNVSVGL